MANVGLACNDHIKVLYSSIMPLYTAEMGQSLMDYLVNIENARYIRVGKNFAMGLVADGYSDIARRANLELITDSLEKATGANDHGRISLRSLKHTSVVIYDHSFDLFFLSSNGKLVTKPIIGDYMSDELKTRLRSQGAIDVAEYSAIMMQAKNETSGILDQMLEHALPRVAVLYTHTDDPINDLRSYSSTV